MAGFKKNTLAIGSIIILVFSVIAFVFVPAAGGQWGSNTKTTLGKWKNIRLDYTDFFYGNTGSFIALPNYADTSEAIIKSNRNL